MSSYTPTGINWADATRPLAARMTDELETMPALAEWRDGDPELLAQGRADVPPDARRAGGPYSRERIAFSGPLTMRERTLVTKRWG